MSLSIVNWNVRVCYAQVVANCLRSLAVLIDMSPEIVCLTETHDELLSSAWTHDLLAAGLWVHGQAKSPEGFAVVKRDLWSQVDDLGIDSMPSGRFVSGVTQTSVGEVAVNWDLHPLVWVADRGSPRSGAQDAVAGP